MGVLWIAAGTLLAAAPPNDQENKLAPWLSERVRSSLLAEIRRLKAAIPAEEKVSPEHPAPSAQMICMLLVGACAGSPEVAGLDDAARKEFSLPRGGKLYDVAPGLRVSVADYGIQDKSGSYWTRGAHLFIEEAGKWTEEASGGMVVRELK